MSDVGVISILPLAATMLSLWSTAKDAVGTTHAGEATEVFHSCLPCINPTVLLLATVLCALWILAKGGEKPFHHGISICKVLFISHQVVSDGVFSPLCTMAFINTDLIRSWCTEW